MASYVSYSDHISGTKVQLKYTVPPNMYPVYYLGNIQTTLDFILITCFFDYLNDTYSLDINKYTVLRV